MLLARHAGQRFLGERDRRILVLLEIQVREILHILQRETGGVHHRVALRQRHARRRLDELDEFETRGIQCSVHLVSRGRSLKQHAQVALPAGDVVDDALRSAVAQRVGVRVAAQR